MKKLHLAVLAVVTLFLLSVTGYAHPTHGNGHELGNKTRLGTVEAWPISNLEFRVAGIGSDNVMALSIRYF